MTALLEKVFAQARQLPAEEQDAVALKLQQTLAEWTKENHTVLQKPRPRFGSAQGMFTLSSEFDEPILMS